MKEAEVGRRRLRVREIIFEHDTAAGKAFDVVLILAILVSVGVVMLDSVASVTLRHGLALRRAEWLFTILFTIEYVLRLYTAPSAGRYARSFYGVVDLLAVLPTYLALVFPSGRYLISIRILRILRVFRVLKLAQFIGGERIILSALKASRHKIAVFLFTVLTVVVVVGSLLYVVEGADAGFTSIPRSVYWAVVTLTTVGYGDIAPQTPVGQVLASMVMILGYGIIAVPTGIVTVEIAAASRATRTASCPACGEPRHDADARFCKRCGGWLKAEGTPEEKGALKAEGAPAESRAPTGDPRAGYGPEGSQAR